MGIVVRRAEARDIDWMVSKFAEHDEEYPSKYRLYNPEHAPKALADGIVNHLVLVAERDNELLGYIAGWVSSHYFNPDMKVLTQALWYVVPGLRGGRAAKKLLTAFTEFGNKYCNWIWIDLPITTKINQRSLERNGYRFQEKWYLREV